MATKFKLDDVEPTLTRAIIQMSALDTTATGSADQRKATRDLTETINDLEWMQAELRRTLERGMGIAEVNSDDEKFAYWLRCERGYRQVVDALPVIKDAIV